MKIQHLLLVSIMMLVGFTSCTKDEELDVTAFTVSFGVAPSYGPDNDKAAQNVLSYYKGLMGNGCSAAIEKTESILGTTYYTIIMNVPTSQKDNLNSTLVASVKDTEKLSSFFPSDIWTGSYSVKGTGDWAIYKKVVNPSLGSKYTATINGKNYELVINGPASKFEDLGNSYSCKYVFTFKCDGANVWSDSMNIDCDATISSNGSDKNSAYFGVRYGYTEDAESGNGAYFLYEENKDGSAMYVSTLLVNGVNILGEGAEKVKMTRQ